MGAIVHPKSVVGAYVHIQNLLLVHMFILDQELLLDLMLQSAS